MLVRRSLPALLAGALLLLPQACGGGSADGGSTGAASADGRLEGRPDQAHTPADPLASGVGGDPYYGGARGTRPAPGRQTGQARLQGRTPGGRASTVELRPTFEEALQLRETALLLLAYRQEDVNPSGFPIRGARPIFQWQQPWGPVTWPARAEVRLPVQPGLRLFAVVDVNADGRLGPGDHVAVSPRALAIPADPAQAIAMRVDRTLPSPEPAAELVTGGCGGGEPTPATPDLAQPRTSAGIHLDTAEHELVVSRGAGASLAEPGMVIVQGYSPGRLTEGNPPFGEPPDFYWSGLDQDDTWPLTLLAQLPIGLDVLVVVDADGDSSPSPSDWSSEALPDLQLPADGEPLRAELARHFVPSLETASDLPMPLGPTGLVPGDDDDSAVTSTAVAVEAPAQTASRLVLDSDPRVPFLRESTVMVVGYRAADVERGMPITGARPIAFWRSGDLQLDWPLEIEAPLPSGTTLFLILDLDADGLPSPGDLSSEAQVDFQPPPEGVKAEFVFRRAYGLPDPAQ